MSAHREGPAGMAVQEMAMLEPEERIEHESRRTFGERPPPAGAVMPQMWRSSGSGSWLIAVLGLIAAVSLLLWAGT